MSWISEEEAESAVSYLRDSATALGEARRKLVLAERMVDRTKALEMKRHSDLPVSAQEREAKASQAMLDAYLAEAVATGEYEKLRALKDAAAARLDAWRTLTSMQKAMMK